MRILVTGARGMLGTDLVCVLEEIGHEVFATDVQELDITKMDFLDKMTGDICPDVVINCAAYTDVDKAEEERERAFLVNGLGVKNIALACKKWGVDICHISTDYVFDGAKEEPYMPDDTPHPINTYGESKLAGERYIQGILDEFYIVRTSWLYGRYGQNFVNKIVELMKNKKDLRIVDDQWGSPTWTVTLSQAITRIISAQKYGLYHVTDVTDGGISWYHFAQEIVKLSGFDAEVIPVKAGDFPVVAERPRNSVLDLSKAKDVLNKSMPWWNDSLKKFLSSI